MANSTISGLTNAGTLTGAERVPVVQGGSTVDCTTQAIANLNGARVLLGTQTASGSSASLSFTSIPSTYHGLVIEMLGRGTSVPDIESIYVQVNGDTTNSYSRQIDWSNSGTPTSYNSSSNPSGYPGYIPSSGATTGAYGLVTLHIPFYAGSTFKTISSNVAFAASNASGKTYRMDATTVWHKTTAINRVDLLVTVGNLASGTTARLYGIS